MTDAPFVPFADNDAAVARKMLDLYDADAVLRLKDQAEEANRIGDTRSARAWLDIAECVMDLLLERAAASTVKAARLEHASRSSR
jgi:hypothetical protein